MLIKKYKNRKLYSPELSEYVTFEQIAEHADTLRVLCNSNKNDITPEVLKSILAARIMTQDFNTAMERSKNIIARLENYIPNNILPVRKIHGYNLMATPTTIGD